MRTLPTHRKGPSLGRYGLIGIATLLLLVSISACGGDLVAPASGLSPAQLDLSLTLIDDPQQGNPSVSMTFHHGSEEVSFLDGGVTCNGVELYVDSDRKQYSGALPRVPAGAAYHCSYNLITIDFLGRTHNEGERAAIDVIAREPPVILTPRAGDKLPRVRPLTVTYAAASSAGVQVVAYGPFNAIGATPGVRADTGTYDGIDVSSFYEGSGSVVVRRTYGEIPTGTGFQSVQMTYNVFASVYVAWT